MKEQRTFFSSIFCCITAVLALFVFPQITDASDPGSLGTPGDGKTLAIALGSPLHLNPAIQSGIMTGVPGAQLFATPLRFDANWNPQPYLAEKWEFSKDDRSLTLHLVRGATFHDGRPITSADVAFSVELVRNHHPFNQMLSPVERVDTPDPHTAVIRLKAPHPAILLAMSSALLPILPKHVYGDGQDIRTHPANMAPVGSGPFKFVEFVQGSHILLERYENFFLKGRPYLDQIRFYIYHESHAEIPISLEANETHMYPFCESLMIQDRASDVPHLNVSSKGYQGIGSILWLGFNLRKKPFDDLRVRQAFAYSIDRDFIVNTLFGSKVRKATGPIHPDSPFYSGDVETFPADIAKANELLDAAGYPRDDTGRRFKVTLDYIPADLGVFLSLAEYLRQDLLRKIGVELQIPTYANDFSEWAKRVAGGEFEITLDEVFNWGDPVIGVHRTYDGRNIRKGVLYANNQNYQNPEVDALMAAAMTEPDFEKRKAIYAKFQKAVVRDLPVLWLMAPHFATIHHKNLVGVDDSIWGAIAPLDQVYWRTHPPGK